MPTCRTRSHATQLQAENGVSTCWEGEKQKIARMGCLNGRVNYGSMAQAYKECHLPIVLSRRYVYRSRPILSLTI